MATRTRYKSPSPVPSTKHHDPLPDALSASHFHAQYPQFQNRSDPPPPSPPTEQFYDPRFSGGRYPLKKPPALPILSYHNAAPDHFRTTGEIVPVVLPLPGRYDAGAETPFGYTGASARAEEKSRSLSIQSLISSPGMGEESAQGRKRKGSDTDESVRETRHGSLVPASVSIEDPDVREVVEALGGLKGDFTPTSPPLQQPENEPLIDLITHRAHPLLSSAITTSLSTYAASKSYSASFRYAAESVENRVGLPVSNVVSAVGRRTGLDGVLRRGLQRTAPKEHCKKRKTRGEATEEDAVGALVTREREREMEGTTWQKRLMLSTSGLGVALNDESMKNLKYCLQWLRFLNVHLSKLVTALRSVVEELDNQLAAGQEGCRGLLLGREGQRAALAAKVEGLKAEVVGTMKKVVEVVSNYTGSALPDNARDLIKRHIFSLPQRFAAASASTPASPTTTSSSSSSLVPSSEDDSPRSSANRVLVLAKEGLDMMQQVSAVVEGTIVRAEEWCERLGKKKNDEQEQDEEEREKKRVSWKSKFEGLEERQMSRDGEGDVVMGRR